MTNEFYTKHKEQIEQAINNKFVKYSIGTTDTSSFAVHCYYIDDKNISISTYAKYDKKSKCITGYRTTVTIHNAGKQEQMQDKDKIAHLLYTKLSEQYSDQIAKTCLKHNFDNAAFRKKR